LVITLTSSAARQEAAIAVLTFLDLGYEVASSMVGEMRYINTEPKVLHVR
jgi:hypothetical protein